MDPQMLLVAANTVLALGVLLLGLYVPPPLSNALDQAALYDHPAAVRTVLEETGRDRVKAIIHCQGSTSFMMSACAGLIPEVDTIVTNAVSLHTVVPWWSRAKLRYAVPAVSSALPYLNPGWGDDPPDTASRLLTSSAKLLHRECDNTVCKMVSFTYGSGFPALWRHENLNRDTHARWIPQEFGHVPLSFFKQMHRCVERGNLVSYEGLPGLPEDYAAQEPETDARFAFFAGQYNRCFLPDGQRQIIIQGRQRFEISEIIGTDPFLTARVIRIEENTPQSKESA